MPCLVGERIAVVGHELRKDVPAVEANRSYPGQMVQPDLVDEHALRLDVDQSRDQPLDSDRDVAQTDRAVAGVPKRPRDDPDGVREVDDPRIVRGDLAYARRDFEDDRNRPQRLREPAGSRGLLADAAAGKRKGLVGEASGLSTDAELDEDEAGAVDRAVEIVCDLERAAIPGGVEHPAREAADDLAPLRVDVVEHERPEIEPVSFSREACDELGRVGRAAADDGELHGRLIWLRIKTRRLYDDGVAVVKPWLRRDTQLMCLTR